MLIDYENDRERILARGPYFDSTQEERVRLFTPASDALSSCEKARSAA